MSEHVRKAAGLDKLQEVTDSFERLQSLSGVVVRRTAVGAHAGLEVNPESGGAPMSWTVPSRPRSGP